MKLAVKSYITQHCANSSRSHNPITEKHSLTNEDLYPFSTYYGHFKKNEFSRVFEERVSKFNQAKI